MEKKNEKRYLVTISQYMWADDDTDAYLKAMDMVNEVDFESQGKLIELCEVPWASVNIRKLKI